MAAVSVTSLDLARKKVLVRCDFNVPFDGTTITDPNIDYATVARGFGVHGEGPITDPRDLGPAIKRALDVVRRGEPALIDVVTDPR